MFLKWVILNVPFYSIFVPFHFYLVMTLVVSSLILDNIFVGFADLRSSKNWCNETFFFLDSGSLRGGEGLVCAWAWFVIIV